MRSLSFAGIGVILVVIVALLVGWPSYNVYAARKHGEAELARASQNRQVRVQEALAKYEAADYDAKAEIRRAQGVAAANKSNHDNRIPVEASGFKREMHKQRPIDKKNGYVAMD